MSVWFIAPTKRPASESTLAEWVRMGYQVAVCREPGDGPVPYDVCIPVDRYLGWARSVNMLAKFVFAHDPKCDWVVTGGDDYLPDLNHEPEQIASQCCAHFSPRNRGFGICTFGVMQPTGDRWGEGPCTTCDGFGIVARDASKCLDCNGTGRSALLDRICGSPWLGREFCQRMYQGNGPLFGGYHHMFADEELQNVARKLGVLWQRRDLIHLHQHWTRTENPEKQPAWVEKVSGPEEWNKSKSLFDYRKLKGFPGHEPLPF